jgi:hypothetical protein
MERLMNYLPVLLAILVFLSSCTPAPAAAPAQSPTEMPPLASTATPTEPVLPTATAGSLVLQPFGIVAIAPEEVEFDVDGEGSNVDSLSFWEAPDPAQSLMFVTSKGNEFIEVYRHPFQQQLQTIACGDESNGVWVDQERDVLYITQRDSSNVCAFDLPALQANESLSFTTAATGGSSEPNLTMLALPGGKKLIYVSYDETVYFHDAGTGEALGQFSTVEGLETMYGDDHYQVLYIPDEGGGSGVFLYAPDGARVGMSFGEDGVFDSDAEGIWVYKCISGGTDTGEGLIVVSDQEDDLTDFEVFHRNTKEHLGTINISGVNNTDGISIMQQPSPEYPMGLLAVIDDDTSTVGVGWDTIFEKTGLSCGG